MEFRDEAAHRHRPPGAGAPSGGNGRQCRDLTPSSRLPHGEEEQVRTDVGYRGIGKRVFGCDMVRHRGLERNVQRLAPLLGFSNLMIAQPHLS